MSKSDLILKAKKTGIWKCIRTGCTKDAAGNIDSKTKKFKTNLGTAPEFCAEHGKELEEKINA